MLFCFLAPWYSCESLLTCSGLRIPALQRFLHHLLPSSSTASLSFILPATLHPVLPLISQFQIGLPVSSNHGSIALQGQQPLHVAKTKTPFLALLDFLAASGCPILHGSRSSSGLPYHAPPGFSQPLGPSFLSLFVRLDLEVICLNKVWHWNPVLFALALNCWNPDLISSPPVSMPNKHLHVNMSKVKPSLNF